MKNLYYIIETDMYNEYAEIIGEAFTNKAKAIKECNRLARLQNLGNKYYHTHNTDRHYVTTSNIFTKENRKINTDTIVWRSY